MAGSSTAKKEVRTLVSTLEAMLRVVTPDHPFQPVLAASIDPHAWRALFAELCSRLASICKVGKAVDKLGIACHDLHTFAATIFADSHFDHFHAAENPDRDATEFAPVHEFFENNPHWLKATQASKPWIELIQNRLESLEDRWKTSCRILSGLLEIGPYASVWPVVHEFCIRVPPEDAAQINRDRRQLFENAPEWKKLTKGYHPNQFAERFGMMEKAKSKARAKSKSQEPETGLEWLAPVQPGPDYKKRLRFQMKRAEVLVSDIFLPTLDAAVSKAFSGKGPTGRGTRQEAKKRLGKAAAEVLACAHLQQGWETLREHAVIAGALRTLLTAVRGALPQPKASSQAKPSKGQDLPLLQSLRQIPWEVLDTTLKARWDEHLKDPLEMEAVAAAIQLLADGHTEVSQNRLAQRLQANAKDDQSSGWEDKAEERLRKLGTDMMAIHGAENWVHQAIGVSRSKEFRKPRDGYGWLVNPLLVLWDPVYTGL